MADLETQIEKETFEVDLASTEEEAGIISEDVNFLDSEQIETNKLKQPLSAAPTSVPKNFYEQEEHYDGSLYKNINNTWTKIGGGWSLVDSGSATVTTGTMSITGLDLETDGNYRVVVHWNGKETTNAGTSLGVKLNDISSGYNWMFDGYRVRASDDGYSVSQTGSNDSATGAYITVARDAVYCIIEMDVALFTIGGDTHAIVRGTSSSRNTNTSNTANYFLNSANFTGHLKTDANVTQIALTESGAYKYWIYKPN